MDRDEAIRRAEIAMAWARGDEVEHFSHVMKRWEPVNGPERSLGPLFFEAAAEFRIKPKPLECWAGINPDGSPTGCTIWRDDAPETDFAGCRWVRMREVTNETDD